MAYATEPLAWTCSQPGRSATHADWFGSHLVECASRSIKSLIDFFLSVRCAEKCCFKLRWRQINPKIEHPMMKLRKFCSIGFGRVLVVVNSPGLEKPCEHRAAPSAGKLHSAALHCFSKAIHKS